MGQVAHPLTCVHISLHAHTCAHICMHICTHAHSTRLLNWKDNVDSLLHREEVHVGTVRTGKRFMSVQYVQGRGSCRYSTYREEVHVGTVRTGKEVHVGTVRTGKRSMAVQYVQWTSQETNTALRCNDEYQRIGTQVVFCCCLIILHSYYFRLTYK